ncbi:hypothetical protein ROLI_033180 [Roseobacter fucihabitans]|uniref:GIY-YIG nuclease family protein n=1 Tax=Roseobacter fucihabitans TaxID=1537242 RepID=A0ABZ2BVZ2_9RHOB|nr:hypothetical protein [Roseobacter litoralis]MBC6966736.1 hypothetical protein [Roseobacter litoralis]
MADFVETREEIIQNVDTLYQYGLGDGPQRSFHDGRIKNGKVFVAVRQGDDYRFAPSKFAGYAANDLEHERKLSERDGGITSKRIESIAGPPLEIGSAAYRSVDAAYLAYCTARGIEPSRHQMSRRYLIIEKEARISPGFFWTKVWGQPDEPAKDALAFNSERIRDRVLKFTQPGDIVVYLTSDTTDADPLVRGRVAGAVEIAGAPVMVEEIRAAERIRPHEYREDGRFRWPFGISVSRTWRVIDQESNDSLISDHAAKGIQGAATIHPMTPEEVVRFRSLRVAEQTPDGERGSEPFRTSVRSAWHQKPGQRAGADVAPGCQLYIAVIHDDHGMTVKVGSGKAEDRLKELNRYRRVSQGETVWSLYQQYEFDTAAAARAAEDHLLREAHAAGFGSPDHSEFILGMEMRALNKLFAEVVEMGETFNE